MNPGYLYVLVHPSDPELHKVGVTTLHPTVRLRQHNRQFEKHAGRIVKETGREWELKTHIAVPDPYWAEAVFWNATGLADVPYRNGVEVQRMSWATVQVGLDAAKDAGMRPPTPVPQWVFAYTTWMKRRLEGRGITLLGHVRSKFGKSEFECTNGHKWRTTPIDVAEGEGCPQCGIGKAHPEEIRRAIGASTLVLLVHPDQPGLIRIELTQSILDKYDWGGWGVHRYRHVDDSVLAESLIWDLLGRQMPHGCEPIRLDLRKAEQAFRELVPRMQEELALMERGREHSARHRRPDGSRHGSGR